jgi:hypothetical protein
MRWIGLPQEEFSCERFNKRRMPSSGMLRRVALVH